MEVSLLQPLGGCLQRKLSPENSSLPPYTAFGGVSGSEPIRDHWHSLLSNTRGRAHVDKMQLQVPRFLIVPHKSLLMLKKKSQENPCAILTIGTGSLCSLG